MNRHTIQKQCGFSLLEVLIALLVLSIGLLGLAALQTTSLRSNEMASMRTTATQLAYDISDRMRANPAGVADNQYVIALTEDPGDTSATGRALDDITEWRDSVHDLPGNLGTIDGVNMPPGGASAITQCDTADGCDGLTHIITVYWDEMRTGASGTNCPPQSENDLRCYQLIFSE
jgi:type IV pilus assembly protein PilV